MNIIEVPNTGIGEYVSQNRDCFLRSHITITHASSIAEARLSDHSRKYPGTLHDIPKGAVIELLGRPWLPSYLVRQVDGSWRDIQNWRNVSSDEIPKAYNVDTITIIYNPAQNMNFPNDTDSAAMEADMN